VIEAVPAHAEVFLNDRLLGRADQVAAWLIPVIPGSQTITVRAAGFRPFSARVITRPIGIPTRVRVNLERE
jgi:hypothetical protein